MKGSFAAPLFLLSLGFACAGSVLGTVSPWAASALAAALAGWAGAAGRHAQSWLSRAVACFGLLIALNTLMISPAYTPAGLYHPLLLVLGFLATRQLTDRTLKGTAFAAFSLGAILAVWGLLQIGVLGVTRAHALFETPATYAAVLNLLGLPVLAAVFVTRRSPWLLTTGGLYAAGLFAADSRGGLLALTAGVGAAVILGLRAGLLQRRGIGLVLGVLAAGWLATTTFRALPTADPTAPTANLRAESSLSRLELYSLSWHAWLERPLSGTGYLTFPYTLEGGRSQVPSYGNTNQTWFVHNDYLQTLQELGPVGLLALLGIALVPPVLAYRRLPTIPEQRRAVVVAATSALAAMAVHAAVDFPFYVPVCLLLYGALLGVLDQRLDASGPAALSAGGTALWFRAARAGALTLAAVLLLRPLAAEVAAEWGLRKSAAGEGQGAAFWLGAAQRIDPRDWRYHWYAGQFWDGQASVSGRRETARLAAEAYAAGFNANPMEVKNLLGKISVQRRHRHLLDQPADPGTLRQWLAQAEALAPLNPGVQQELAR